MHGAGAVSRDRVRANDDDDDNNNDVVDDDCRACRRDASRPDAGSTALPNLSPEASPREVARVEGRRVTHGPVIFPSV